MLKVLAEHKILFSNSFSVLPFLSDVSPNLDSDSKISQLYTLRLIFKLCQILYHLHLLLKIFIAFHCYHSLQYCFPSSISSRTVILKQKSTSPFSSLLSPLGWSAIPKHNSPSFEPFLCYLQQILPHPFRNSITILAHLLLNLQSISSLSPASIFYAIFSSAGIHLHFSHHHSFLTLICQIIYSVLDRNVSPLITGPASLADFII